MLDLSKKERDSFNKSMALICKDIWVSIDLMFIFPKFVKLL